MSQVLLDYTLDHPALAGLNPEQQQAVTAPGHVRVMAGPGTGKTEVIARRYVWLWQQLQAEHPDADTDWLENRLLVVTFTNKSAAEMTQRITQRLTDALGYAVSLSGRWIGTFHAICQQWLAQWGTPPTLLTNLQQFLLDKQLVDQLLETGLPDCTDALNAASLTALPGDLLSLDKLAALPLDEVVPFIQDLPKLILRIQAAGLSPLSFYHTALDQTRAFTACIKQLPATYPHTGQWFDTAADAMDAWQRVLSPYASPLWQRPPAGDKDSDVFRPLQPVRDALLGKKDTKTKTYPPQDIPALHHQLDAITATEETLIPIVAAFYAWRNHTLKQQNQCDYDGLIQAVLDTWTARPDLLTNRVATQFAAVIVDEFQDTNPAQCALLAALQPAKGLMVVGDRKQSIYGFRFAEPDNLTQVFAGKSPVLSVSLIRNYRSVPAVVHLANRFAASQQLDDTPPLQAVCAPQPDVDPFTQQDADTGKLAQQRETEASVLIHTLQAQRPRYHWGDMAVLCQKNHRAMAVFTQLSQQGIPARLQKIPGLMAQPVIRDATAMMQVLIALAVPDVEPDDTLSLAWVRLLQHYLTDGELYALSKAVKPFSLATGIKSQFYQRTLDPMLMPLVTALTQASVDLEPAVLQQRVEQVMEATGWMEAYAPHKLQLEAFAHWQFLAEDTIKTATSLTDCMDTFALYEQYPGLIPDMPDSSGEAVTILTGHSAKGLEYPVVCLAWTDGPSMLKPGSRTVVFEPQHAAAPGMGLVLREWAGQKTLKAELVERLWQKPRLDAEQQRLFYVALTRAKTGLHLFRSAQSPPWTDVALLADTVL